VWSASPNPKRPGLTRRSSWLKHGCDGWPGGVAVSSSSNLFTALQGRFWSTSGRPECNQTACTNRNATMARCGEEFQSLLRLCPDDFGRRSASRVVTVHLTHVSFLFLRTHNAVTSSIDYTRIGQRPEDTYTTAPHPLSLSLDTCPPPRCLAQTSPSRRPCPPSPT
jgi:hypothetical protein